MDFWPTIALAFFLIFRDFPFLFEILQFIGKEKECFADRGSSGSRRQSPNIAPERSLSRHVHSSDGLVLDAMELLRGHKIGHNSKEEPITASVSLLANATVSGD